MRAGSATAHVLTHSPKGPPGDCRASSMDEARSCFHPHHVPHKHPGQRIPPVAQRCASSKPKTTDVCSSPHIPQETLIYEFVKPPGSLRGKQKLQLCRLHGALDCCTRVPAQSPVPLPRATRDLHFPLFLRSREGVQRQQDRAERSTRELGAFVMRTGLIIPLSAMIK